MGMFVLQRPDFQETLKGNQDTKEKWKSGCRVLCKYMLSAGRVRTQTGCGSYDSGWSEAVVSFLIG